MIYILGALCLAFGIARFYVPVSGLRKQDIYKDMAHILVGVVLGCAILESGWYWALFAGFTTVEVAAFFIRR